MRTIFCYRHLLACLLPLLAAGCSDREEEAREALSSDAGILSYIPENSPYVFVGVEPLPDEVRDKLAGYNSQILNSYRTVIDSALEGEFDGAEEGVLADEEARERLKAVINGLADMMTDEGMPEAGIDRTSTGALYGVGLMPVVRITLTDDALFESALVELENKAGGKMDTASLDGYAYRYTDLDKARLIIAANDDQLVATLVPQALSDEMLKSVLGLAPPARSIAQSGYLEALAGKYGYTSFGLGFVDFERIVASFLDDPGGADAELLGMLDYDATSLSDACREEIRSIVGIGPRLVTGYTEVSAENLKSNTVLELRSDIASGLSKLTSPVPGLGAPHQSLFSFGMSFNLPALREFYSARLDALEADPYECELFAGLQENIAAGREKLNQPVPPIVYGLTGFLAVIDDISGFDFETKQPPERIDASFLVATSDAQSLVAMGAMFSPDLAALDLKPDGKAVPLPLPAAAAGTIDTAYVAMSEKALAVSVGAGSQARLETLVASSPTTPPPFMSMDMDAGRYYTFLGEAIKLGNEQAEESESAEIAQATSNMMSTFGKVFSRIAVDVEFTERGIEVPSTVVLAP